MADLRPTVFVTNWSSRKLHGSGRKFTIMALPRRWEYGDGKVPLLTPSEQDLLAVRAEDISVAEYRTRFLAKVDRVVGLGETGGQQQLRWSLKPGELFAIVPGPIETRGSLVEDADTLCCACSREAAERGQCHRVWAAHLLVEAGWRVVLDGVEIVAAAEQYRREQEGA